MSRRLSSSQKAIQTLRRRVASAEAKANPLYAGYSAMANMPEARTMRRDVRTYIQEGYEASDTLYKVINYGIINGAAIPPVLYTDATMKKKIDSHPLLDKLETPNPEYDGVFYREAILGWFLLAGSSFMYAVRVGKSGPPDELWFLESNKTHPIPDKKRGIIGYKYDDFEEENKIIPPGLIGHMRTWNPRDPFFGLSPVTVAAILVDQQTAIRKWNLALLQNKAVPSGAWVTDVLLSPNDREKLEAKANEKFAGYRNAGKVPVLDGALKWMASAVSPSDLDWLEGLKYNAGAIANIFNMPPQLIGDTSSTTYNNMTEAKAASYTEYIFPMLDKMYSVLRRWLMPMYPDLQKAYLYYDKTTVEVVQEAIQGRLTASAQRANQSWSQGAASSCTLNEAREMQGLPPDPQGDVYRFGAVIVSKDKLEEYAEQSLTKPAGPPMLAPEPLNVDPTQSQQGNTDANNNPDNNSGKPANKPTGKQPDSGKDDEKGGKRRVLRSTKALDLSTTEEKRAYANSIENARKKHEDEYERQLSIYFDQERKAVVKAIESSASRSQHILAARVEGAINDQQDDLKTVLMDLYKDVMVDIGGSVSSQLSGQKSVLTDFLKLFGEKQLRYLLTMAGTKIKQITSTTLSKIRLELAEGVTNGESIPQIAKRIDQLYLEQIIPNRSTTIARTEVVASSNYSSIQAAQSSGLTLTKVWLATEDSRTRPAHAAADGQEVGMDEAFDVGGEALQYPGDSDNGSADNVCNCRCTLFYRRAASQADVSDTSEEEKRARRNGYRKFMDEVLV